MYHLTKPQKLIYDMEKYAGGSISNVCGSIVIKGSKDISVLTNAVNELYRLNDALRIRITETDGIPYQTVSAYKEQKINVLHFADKEELNSYAEKYAQEPMDFYGSLCEINVILLNDGYGLLVKLHHIISDAWTLSLVGSQFNTLANGEIPEAYSYIDYIPAEQEYFNGKRYPKDREYYIEQYKKCDDITYISDKQVNTFVSNRKHFLIDEEKTAKIQNYANEHKTSVYMLLMTALGTYINRIKMNQEKFYIGTAILNRTNVQEKNTMGMFINTAPVLMELDNGKTFSENLRTISKTLFGIIKHQKFNYGEVLETLRNGFDFSGNLYDVMLSYQNAKFTGIDTDFESVWYCNGMQTESLQMHIDDRDSEGILKIHYDYQTEKFTEKEIERMHEHIFNLLFDAINEDKQITELAILSDKEKTTLLCDFNDTKADYPKDKCVHQLFEEQVLKAPDKIALKFANREFTYHQLNSMANTVAYELSKMGVGKNDIVALISKRSYHLVVAILGILKAGGAYLPIDYNYPQDRIDYIIDDANCKAIVAFDVEIDRDNVLKLENEIALVDEDLQCINSFNDLCAVIYTSGSTGTPKGTLLHHKGLVNYTYANDSLYEGGDCNIGFATYTFDAFFLDIIPPMLRGNLAVMATEDEQFNSKSFGNLIKSNPKCNFFITPAKLKQFVDSSEDISFLNDIRKICIGGEVFPEDLLELFSGKTKVFNVYGPTECSMWSVGGEIR